MTGPPQDPDREEKIAAEILIMKLLGGYDVNTEGVEITRYLTHNSPEEREARVALAREVRSCMRGFAGELLALAIDPSTPSTWPDMRPTRKVRFESPSRGKASTLLRDKAVVHFITQQLRESPKLEAAVAAAGAHYELRRSQVRKIWTRRAKLIEWPSAK
jgi:hypothetical protein